MTPEVVAGVTAVLLAAIALVGKMLDARNAERARVLDVRNAARTDMAVASEVAAQIDAWKGLADVREVEAHDCNERLAKVEAQVAALRSAWMVGVAVDVVDAVLAELRERAERGGS